MVESGMILLKYWLEVSQEEQTRRLESRIDDGRKTLEALADGPRSPTAAGTTTLGPATRCSRRPTHLGALVRGPLRRQEAGAAQHHQPPARAKSPTKEAPREKVKLPKRSDKRPTTIRRRLKAGISCRRNTDIHRAPSGDLERRCDANERLLPPNSLTEESSPCPRINRHEFAESPAGKRSAG